ncbi:MAG TPA: hypothetical protein VIF62_26945 [Labilithrix sp.]
MSERNLGRAALMAAGAATMLVELTVLRYVPGSIRVLGYFTNFVLLAAFVGLGTGMLAARRARPWAAWLSPVAIGSLVVLTELGRHVTVTSAGEEVLFLEYATRSVEAPLVPFLAVAYVVLALAFVPLGVFVGTTLAGDDSLERYAWNVGGSLLGVIAFSALAASGARPAMWMAAALVPVAVALANAPLKWRAIGAAAAIVAVAGVAHGTSGAVWSPYQKITIAPIRIHPALGIVPEWTLPRLAPDARAALVELPEAEGFTVRVNDDSYQTPIDLSDAAIARHPSLEPLRVQYDLPFLGRPPGVVLVLGAGTGNDVAGALRAGALHVDAVEIDPEILALGLRHPEHPYADPRVTAHLSDARSFLARRDILYDTIVFGLLDSHVLLSSMSNVRLDSFVFTKESFALARSRLRPTGILVVSHAVGAPWFVDRMRTTLWRAFDMPPLVLSERVQHPFGVAYASGDTLPPGKPPPHRAGILEDDWPFVYLRARRIPREYLIAMALMAASSLALVRVAAGKRLARLDPHFFFLGAGFLLLETRGLAVLSLLLGTTWSVTSSVFAAVLVMALGAAAIGARVAKSPSPPRALVFAYAFLGAALLLQHGIEPADLASFAPLLRASLGATLAALPLLASGVVFATSLARSGDADRALASNLLGAIAGGIAEYASMMIGFRALVLVAGAFYLLAFFTRNRSPERALA